MEHRFTLKDFTLLGAIALVGTLTLLSMYMVDRQWNKMDQMQAVMTEQAQDLRALKTLIRGLNQQVQQGVVGAATAHPSTSANDGIPPAFQRAYQASQQTDYSEGDWLMQSFSVNLKSLTPFISEDAYASEVESYVLESLLTRNPQTLEWDGLIAKSWQVSEDGLSFTFQLREDVKFSDGQPLDASDVVFSFDFLMNPSIQAPRERSYYSKIETVTATTPYEVVFKFKEPYFKALDLAGGMAIMPEHFYAPYLKKSNTYNQSKGLLLGSGPYRLNDPSSWTPDKGLVELERNPRYWGAVQPGFDRLIWTIIENASARLITFRNRDIDVYSARPREYQKLLKDPAINQSTNHWEYMNPVGGYSYIGWNQKKSGSATPFADRRVREAMTYLTDRERLAKDIFLGYSETALGPFTPLGHQHDPALQARAYNPQKAKNLLRQAGYEDRNHDGVLENTNGQPFKFELVYFQDSEDTQKMVLFLKDLYARAGIVLEPKPSEWSIMLDLLKKRDFDAITLGWGGTLESDLYQMFHSSQIEDGGNNSIGYSNPEFDKLVEQARATVDEKQRMPLWHQAEALLYQDQPYTFLLRKKSLVFIDKRIQNINNTATGLNLRQTPLEIYVPAEQQRHSH